MLKSASGVPFRNAVVRKYFYLIIRNVNVSYFEHIANCSKLLLCPLQSVYTTCRCDSCQGNQNIQLSCESKLIRNHISRMRWMWKLNQFVVSRCLCLAIILLCKLPHSKLIFLFLKFSKLLINVFIFFNKRLIDDSKVELFSGNDLTVTSKLQQLALLVRIIFYAPEKNTLNMLVYNRFVIRKRNFHHRKLRRWRW